MARNKLIPFLREGLDKKAFTILNWVDEKSGKFCVDFPTYGNKNTVKEEVKMILKAWHAYKENKLKYQSYTYARTAFLNAMNTSPYLIKEPNDNKKYCYRFATSAEIKVKRLEKKERAKRSTLTIDDPFHENSSLSPKSIESLPTPCSLMSPDPPPSNSSGYESWEENFHEDLYLKTATELPNCQKDHELDHMILKYLDEFTNDDNFNDILGGINEFVPLEDINKHELFQPDKELITMVMNISAVVKTIWMCTTKLYISTTVVLVCEKKNIEVENEEIAEGQIVIPNSVWEPGESYSMQKALKIDEKYFLFLIPDSGCPATDSA